MLGGARLGAWNWVMEVTSASTTEPPTKGDGSGNQLAITDGEDTCPLSGFLGISPRPTTPCRGRQSTVDDVEASSCLGILGFGVARTRDFLGRPVVLAGSVLGVTALLPRSTTSACSAFFLPALDLLVFVTSDSTSC
jgi:hypothetical protein